jgi:hypothetical protein
MAKLMGILSAARIQFPLASLHLMKINALKSRGVRDYGWKDTYEKFDNGRIEILDRSDKRECSSNIDKASSATSNTSNGCSGADMGSGININFCSVINSTISPQFNPSISPTIQPEIKPIICELSSNGLREMKRKYESSIQQQERVSSNSLGVKSLCTDNWGKQDQINSVVFRQLHSSLQPEPKSWGDNIIQEPSQTIIVNNYYGSEYSSGTRAGYLQRSRRLSESFGISRRLSDKQDFTFFPFEQVGCFPGRRSFCNIFDSFMQEFLFHKKV